MKIGGVNLAAFWALIYSPFCPYRADARFSLLLLGLGANLDNHWVLLDEDKLF